MLKHSKTATHNKDIKQNKEMSRLYKKLIGIIT
jgi:hypothetical protein